MAGLICKISAFLEKIDHAFGTVSRKNINLDQICSHFGFNTSRWHQVTTKSLNMEQMPEINEEPHIKCYQSVIHDAMGTIL